MLKILAKIALGIILIFFITIVMLTDDQLLRGIYVIYLTIHSFSCGRVYQAYKD